MNIALHHFRLIDAIYKQGTLTKAAISLHLTQSALSHQLKELESELKIEIFHRKGKRLVLSDEGIRFLNSSESILAEIRSLEEDLYNYKTGKTGKINICMQCYTNYHWLPGVVRDYKISNPDLDINIASEAMQRPLEYLLRGDLDVALVRTQIINNKIKYETLCHDKVVVVMHKENSLANKDLIGTKDFNGQTLILPPYDSSYQETPIIESSIYAEQVKSCTIYRMHYTDVTIKMIKENLGIGIISDWIMEPYLNDEDIVIRPLSPELAERTWYLAYCKQDAAVVGFIQCLRQAMERHESGRILNLISG